MRFTNIISLITLLAGAFVAHAQQPVLIKDTVHYTLEEVDSTYYFSHGAEMVSDFEIDSTTHYFNNGMVRLPLQNNAFLEMGDTMSLIHPGKILACEYIGESQKVNCYLVGIQPRHGDYKTYLIDKNTGKTDTIDNVPSFSPSHQVYVSNYYYPDAHEAGIYIKNHQTNKGIRIALFQQLDKSYRATIPYYYRWLSNEVFMVHTLPFFGPNSEVGPIHYFMITLKD